MGDRHLKFHEVRGNLCAAGGRGAGEDPLSAPEVENSLADKKLREMVEEDVTTEVVHGRAGP